MTTISTGSSPLFTCLVFLAFVAGCASSSGDDSSSNGLTAGDESGGEAGDASDSENSGGAEGFEKVEDLAEGVYEVLYLTENLVSCDENAATPVEGAQPYAYVRHFLLHANGGEPGNSAQGEACGSAWDCELGLQCADDDTCQPCADDLDCKHSNSCDLSTGLCQDRMSMGIFGCPDVAACETARAMEEDDYTQYLFGGDRVIDGEIYGYRGHQDIDGAGNCTGSRGDQYTSEASDGFSVRTEGRIVEDWVPCEDLEGALDAAPCTGSQYMSARLVGE